MSTSRWLWFTCFLVSTCLAGAATAQDLEAQLDGAVRQVKYEPTEMAQAAADRYVWQKEVDQIGTEHVRFHVTTELGPDDNDLVLTLRDREGNLIRSYTSEDMRNSPTFWTRVVPGDYALLELSAKTKKIGLKFRIDQIAYQAYGGAVLSTWGEYDMEPIANYQNSYGISTAASTVAKLLFIRAGVPRVCTGFMVSDDRMITNEHCVNDQATCRSVVAIFGYEYRREQNRNVLSFGEQYECEKVVPSGVNATLDYAVIQLRGKPGAKWGKLSLLANDTPRGQKLFIVQHPAGMPKQISKLNCAILEAPVEGRGPDTDFSHTCDTGGGSSGSPVFNSSGMVVGLHHYGFNEGLSGIWKENRAVRIQKILSNLPQ